MLSLRLVFLRLKAHDFISLYRADSLVQTIAEGIRMSGPGSLHLKNVHGSLDAVLFASVYKSTKANHLVILHDREEASYFLNDLQNLLENKEILFFPMSYKRPYEYDEIENANVLLRSEALNHISNHPEGNIIVTYPEALSEKVINKKSLASNTFLVIKGEKLDRDFLEEFLHTYDFEKTDFVYEAGQFAVRGGIIDVYSFANELPYRIELFGDEVDGIRTFDPGSQLSVDSFEKVSLMPNVQTRLIREERQSFFEFIPPNSRVWVKDFKLTEDVVQKSFEKASENFDKIIRESGHTKVVLEPHQLFDRGEDFETQLEKFTRIEFGNRFHFQSEKTFEFPSSVQPSF